METVRNLEATISKWYQSMPHLPKDVQKWLSENVWWIVLIGVIVGALALLNVLFFTVLAGSFLTAFGGSVGAAVGAIIFIGILVSVALGVISVILGSMAISPLKAMQKKGWTLLFVILLVEVASTIVTNVLSYNLFGLIWGLLWVAVSGYFLFEVHSYFGATSSRKDRKKVEAHQK
jgi:hypothetical protein